MQKRDLLQEQIEQLGRVLGKVIADFLGSNPNGDVNDSIEISQQTLKDELDLDVNRILELEKSDVLDYVKERNLTDGHLEQLSAYFVAVGKTNSADTNKYYTKAIELLEIADQITATISFERIQKRQEITGLIGE